ncbi:alpha/beta hydrolase [Streptomyces sp. NPDC057367]|uniref:alpha/beta hydrolase n=1 Tax=Streptomyces sp. NPDC057367 TaxID=3346108 RepID=UPI00362878EE
MPDAAAEPGTSAGRAAAEEKSALSRPAVDPDSTAAYGEHPDQVIDFYAPRGAGGAGGRPSPVVVVLHGGSWRAPYDRRHVSPFADFLAHRGFAVASVEYRRGAEGEVGAGAGAGAGAGGGAGAGAGAGGGGGGGAGGGGRGVGGGPVAGRWPDTFDDVAAALDALPALVRQHLPGADPGRTVLTGHSAGGHLALWAAARHLLPADAPWRLDRPAPLRGVVALAPIADFGVAGKMDVCGGAALQFLGGERFYEERRPCADPSLLLPTGIATALVQGRADVDVPQAVAEAYADAAAKAGEVVGLTLLEDVGHFPLIDPAADACAVVAEEIAQLAW